MNTFARYQFASTLLSLLSVFPFVLLLALLAAPLLDGLAPWWSITVVALAYANTIVSDVVYRSVQRMYASIPAIDPTERVSWQQPRLSQTQQEIMSIDLRSVPHASWSRFVFPTVLLALAVVGELFSTVGLVVLIGGLLASLISWMLSSAMLMWPLHHQIYLERDTSPRTLRVLKAIMWGTYGLVWIALSGALLLFLTMSLPLAASWGLGIVFGVTLALWRKPLVENPPPVDGNLA